MTTPPVKFDKRRMALLAGYIIVRIDFAFQWRRCLFDLVVISNAILCRSFFVDMRRLFAQRFLMRLPLSFLTVIILFSPVIHGQTLDIPPRRISNERAAQGGSYRVRVDLVTPLPDLIKRLAGHWDLLETGKAYWIGYTDDMYSIAAHKDVAVEPLLALFRETKDQHTKNGVVLTLHLIGIDSTIIGRFDEKFLNASARKAMLRLIDDVECGDLAVELLARDPWPSDVPMLVDSLAKGKRPRNVLINALFRYARGDTPFRQDIDEAWDKIAIDFRDTAGQKHLGELRIVFRETKKDEPEKVNKMIGAGFVIQWGREGRIVRELVTSDNAESMKQVFGNQKPTEVIYDLFLLSKEKVSEFSFCDLSEEFWHEVEPQQLVIVGPETARQMWLEYFRNKVGLRPSK
jgi:hypothetical protein